jgi:hypothetical protein
MSVAKNDRAPGLFRNSGRAGAVEDCFQFNLLLGGNCELILRLLKIVEERVPLLAGNFKWA